MEKVTKRLLSTQITINIDNLGRNTTLDQGGVEIIYKKPHNTSPLIRLSKNTLIFYYDFACGTNTELEEIKYAVFLVDRRSKYIFEYPLINLNEDKLLDAMKLFINQLRRKPDKMYVDQDYKLVGGKITKLLRNPFDDEYNLLSNGSLLASAPKGCQNQNDLSEINWKEVMKLSRNLITSNLLPSSFWYHGISYTLQVINYMPTRYSNGNWSSLFEQLYKIYPDCRILFPIFSMTYVNGNRDSTIHRKIAHSHSIKAICIGYDKLSYSRLFNIPETKSIISSVDYKLDPSLPSSPYLVLPCDGDKQFQ